MKLQGLAIAGAALLSVALPIRVVHGIQSQTRILVFSRTLGFRHDSIPNGIAAIIQLGVENGFVTDTTEDSSVFNDANLARYKTVVFLSTTGDVLDSNQEAAFQRYLG